MKKQIYNIKAFNGKNWEYLGTTYLNPNDSEEQKEKEIQKIKEEYNISSYLNISNFFNVYN